jgi:putative restriction endonuclease
MCFLGQKLLLDAAHIIPDNDPRSEPMVSNGLSLCKIHHAAYDSRILGVDPDYRIHVRQDVLDEIDGPMLKHGLQELDGDGLKSLPHRKVDKPDRDLLALQFDRFRAA